MMKRPVRVSIIPRRDTRSYSTFFFIGSNKTTGLMVTQHTHTHHIRFLVASGTLVVVLVNVFFLLPRISFCMHILIDGCYWKYPPPHYRIPSHLPRISIPPDAHCQYQPHHIFSLVLPTYNHPGSFYNATCPIAWYPRSYAGLYCVDVPRNLFFKKSIKF